MHGHLLHSPSVPLKNQTPVKPKRQWMAQILLTGWDANSCSLCILSWWDRHRLLWAASSHLGHRKRIKAENVLWCIIQLYRLQGFRCMWRILLLCEETHTCRIEHANSTGTERSWNGTCANLQTWTVHFHQVFIFTGVCEESEWLGCTNPYESVWKLTRWQMFKYGTCGCLFLQ